MRQLIWAGVLVFTLTGCSHSSIDYSARETQEERIIHSLPKAKEDMGSRGVNRARIPIEVNSEVERWISYFQGKGRPHFQRYMERSGRYLTLMKRILRENGVPEDLVYVAMIESGFTGKIRSRAGAKGYWQFMNATGRHYGLRSNRWVDERYDPVMSTKAAASYFKSLYNLFGNWFLAMASYNVGENRVKSVVMRYQTRDFWELARKGRLPNETRHYVPKFIAASLIAKDPGKYGFYDLNYQPAMEFEVIKSKKAIDLRKLAAKVGVSYSEIKALNPAWKSRYALVLRDELAVRVPIGRKDRAFEVMATAQVNDKRFSSYRLPAGSRYSRYRVKSGDVLSQIAEDFNVPLSRLLRVNGLRRNSVIRPGMRLRIPLGAKTQRKRSRKFSMNKRPRRVRVRRGDTLTNLARRYKTTIAQLRQANGMKSNRLYKGQLLKIPALKGARNVYKKYRIRRGDTLSSVARRYGVTLHSLLKANKLALRSKIYKGQMIVIPK